MSKLLDSDREPLPGRWVGPTRIALRVGLAVAVAYLGVNFYERATRPRLERKQGPLRKIHPDAYVYPPKSYVTSVQSAQKLIGKPLWVKEGFRWTYQPGNEVLGPLEKVVPTRIRQAGREVRLTFEKGGVSYTLPIAAGGQFFVDEMFLLKDPRELWTHWSDEDWRKIETNSVEPGMSEHQVVFSLGAGNIIQSSRHSTQRIVDYKLGAEAGMAPVRATYRDGVVERVDPLPAE